MVSFKWDEEELIDLIISVLDTGWHKFTYQTRYPQDKIRYDDIIIGLERREIIRGGQKVELTYTEFEIISFLAQNPSRVFSKEQIYDVVWKNPYSGDYNIVMSHIGHIREKIEDNPSHPVYIQTVWGVGYRFNKK